MTLVVRRSAVRMWLMAMAGIPLLVISLDVLLQRRITNWLRELMFRPEDTQIFEPRDVIWAWAMLVFAVFIVLWGLKELFVPTKVVECIDEGLRLNINGPLRGPAFIPWDAVDDVHGVEVEDEGTRVSMLSIRLLGRRDLPDNPWGARWRGERELALLAEDWADPPGEIASRITDFAVEAARRKAKGRTTGIREAVEEA